MPVSVAKLLISSVNASIPPAEAPTAAINRSFLRSGAGALDSFGTLRKPLRPDDFDFIVLSKSFDRAGYSPGRTESVSFSACAVGLMLFPNLYFENRSDAQLILVLLARGNNLWCRRPENRGSPSGVAPHVDRTSGAALAFKECGGPIGEIIDQLQVPLARLPQGFVMRGHHPPDPPGLSYKGG